MSASEWARVPGHCELSYVHLDERGDSVTLGFSTRQLPPNPPASWRDTEYNTVEFYVVFSGVHDLRVRGWGPEQAREVEVTPDDAGRTRVQLGRQGAGIGFLAQDVTVTRCRAYLSAAE
jgi:hypothetical protein